MLKGKKLQRKLLDDIHPSRSSTSEAINIWEWFGRDIRAYWWENFPLLREIDFLTGVDLLKIYCPDWRSIQSWKRGKRIPLRTQNLTARDYRENMRSRADIYSWGDKKTIRSTVLQGNVQVRKWEYLLGSGWLIKAHFLQDEVGSDLEISLRCIFGRKGGHAMVVPQVPLHGTPACEHLWTLFILLYHNTLLGTFILPTSKLSTMLQRNAISIIICWSAGRSATVVLDPFGLLPDGFLQTLARRFTRVRRLWTTTHRVEDEDSAGPGVEAEAWSTGRTDEDADNEDEDERMVGSRLLVEG